MQKFEEREAVIFENQGQRLFGIMHHPLSVKRAPAVLICHGFAGNKIGKYRIYVQLAQRLAQEGIASFRFDFRGSGDSEGDFSEMTIESEVSDAVTALAYLRQQPNVDPSRVGILGNSFGAAIAVLAAQQDGKVKSLALLAALFNSDPWRKRWELLASSKDEAVRKELSRVLEGYSPGPSFLSGFFKLNLEKQLCDLGNIPLLHIHSERDERVGLDQAEEYKRCRQHAIQESSWIRLKQCDHDFSVPEERLLLIEETAKWFSKTL